MSEVDSFIDEVTEEVRRDKLFAAFRKYGWIAILAVVLLVGGAAWKEYRAAQHKAGAQAFGDAVLAAQSKDKPEAVYKALAAIKAQGAQAAVADLLAAAEAEKAGDTKAALARLDAVSGDKSLPPAFRDLALLKSVTLAGDTMSADRRDQVLAALSQPGRPYRPLALEQLALLAVKAGKTKDAIEQFTKIAQDAGVTPGLRQRATQMIVALGGSPKAAG
ncbi:hypothetical protein U879_00390 [Defluviimonas sp. 20V17]|uniref:Ancillary SecYEG translocon subunit/Cell division coordinator CpoB TPR domain-containing protein n=1 Tax=Allgaiera indica TaxID=765699 RepID=A0AAN4UUD4_9RHOB|nr:tetratricopeptide repeat protein [Allgaiera indica]KDB05637.1 hypothetical protein U879_00390 [Defluviimonas sp. 20V17]GHE04290.1 hypothetical protein GCM10008024_30950 [Allgaiera indica]SDX39321.1 hypothetical protein SAMN05444006_11522 [Allgaiera indica]